MSGRPWLALVLLVAAGCGGGWSEVAAGAVRVSYAGIVESKAIIEERKQAAEERAVREAEPGGATLALEAARERWRPVIAGHDLWVDAHATFATAVLAAMEAGEDGEVPPLTVAQSGIRLLVAWRSLGCLFEELGEEWTLEPPSMLLDLAANIGGFAGTLTAEQRSALVTGRCGR